jgi:hypothetical protein
MAVNPYFSSTENTNEQDLIEGLISECIQIHGINFLYLPRTIVDEDLLFNEDPLSTFTQKYEIEMYLENVESWEGEGDIINRFGQEIRDNATMIVSKPVFEKTMLNVQASPREGDIIYFPLNKTYWEIDFVEDESSFYQRGRLNTYKLVCHLWDYSSERVDTGDTDVDAIEEQLSIDNLTGSLENDPFASNTDIETEADTILVFDENSPFGPTV